MDAPYDVNVDVEDGQTSIEIAYDDASALPDDVTANLQQYGFWDGEEVEEGAVYLPHEHEDLAAEVYNDAVRVVYETELDADDREDAAHAIERIVNGGSTLISPEMVLDEHMDDTAEEPVEDYVSEEQLNDPHADLQRRSGYGGAPK